MFSRHRLAALVVILIALAHLGMACPPACRALLLRCLEANGLNVPTLVIAAGGSVIRGLQGTAWRDACDWSPGASRCGTI